MEKLYNTRIEYYGKSLDENDLPKNPFDLFSRFFEIVRKENFLTPNAMVLSTVNNNIPSSRIVLLKDFSENEFTFFSGKGSRKEIEFSKNPNVSLLFYWDKLFLQIRIIGRVRESKNSFAEKYFATRPRESKIAARVSVQSKTIPNRDFLENRFKEESGKFKNKEIPKPEHWKGYSVVPFEFEFWMGRDRRLHDRIVYVKNKFQDWEIRRLSP